MSSRQKTALRRFSARKFPRVKLEPAASGVRNKTPSARRQAPCRPAAGPPTQSAGSPWLAHSSDRRSFDAPTRATGETTRARRNKRFHLPLTKSLFLDPTPPPPILDTRPRSGDSLPGPPDTGRCHINHTASIGPASAASAASATGRGREPRVMSRLATSAMRWARSALVSTAGSPWEVGRPRLRSARRRGVLPTLALAGARPGWAWLGAYRGHRRPAGRAGPYHSAVLCGGV